MVNDPLFAMDRLMGEARRLAAEYRRTVGRPLAISGEIAGYDAARLLDLELCPASSPGWDALGRGRRAGQRIQIKARAIFDEGKGGQRIGQLKLEQPWDCVVLVLMDDHFEPFEIWEADREQVVAALDPESSRSRRGAMSVARFKAIGRLAWAREEGLIDDEIWDNGHG